MRRSPRLAGDLEALFAAAYKDARKLAEDETGLPIETFPHHCPWSVTQVLDEDFWPESEG